MSPREPSAWLRQVAATEQLASAWRKVEARAAGPGGDGVTVGAYAESVEQRLQRLRARLLDRSYRPPPSRRIRLPEDPARRISRPAVKDRIVQVALCAVLSERLGGRLAACVYSYRRGVSVEHALLEVEQRLCGGCSWQARTDIESFFDRIDPATLLDRLAREGTPADVRALVGRILKTSVLEGAALHEPGGGIAQGGSLSPLLSNLYLAGVDDELGAGPAGYLRYADDVLLLGRMQAEVEEALGRLAGCVENLGLHLQERKTSIGHVARGFTFLGARFDAGGRTWSKAALAALSGRAESLASGGGGADELRALVDSWRRWHGRLRAADVESPELLAGLALDAAARGARAELLEAAAARLRLGAPAGASAELHAALAEAWTSGDAESACLDAALLEARAALQLAKGEGRELVVERTCAALELPATSREDLGRPFEEWAEAFRRVGAAALARRAARLAGPAARAPGGEPVSAELLNAVADRFARHSEAHLLECRNARGHRHLVRTLAPPARRQLRRHLEGGARLAVPLADPRGRTRLAGFHLRPARAAAGAPAGPAAAGEAEPLVHQHLLALARAARRLGLEPLLEDTGKGGRRAWLFFAGPVSLRRARALLVRIEDEASTRPPAVFCERLPASDELRRDHGPPLLLPLGRDPRSGRRSRLLDGAGRPVEAPAAALRAAPLVDPRALGRAPARAPGSRRGEGSLDLARGWRDLPLAASVLSGCPVLARLGCKAKALGFLEGPERSSLVEVIGHLGEEAPAALHRLLEPTGRGAAAHVRRRLRSLPSHPLSCSKLRERHRLVAADADCACRFRGLFPGAYPTPLLHALQPRQVEGWKQLRRQRSGWPRQGAASQASAPREAPPAAAALDDMVRALAAARRSGEAGLEQAEAALLAELDRRGGEAAETSFGRLVVLRREPPVLAVLP